MTTHTASYIKMSARRSLADVFGEPDHEQNKRDLDFWSRYYDRQFQDRWGVDPTHDLVDGTRWQKVSPEDYLPNTYCSSSLEWACNPKKRGARCCSTHLGLQSSRTGSPSGQGKPLGEVNTNSMSCTRSTVDDLPSTVSSGQLTPLVNEDTNNVDLVRSQCQSPTPSSSTSQLLITSSPSSPFQSSPTCSPSSSRKRKQSTISEFFPQKKRTRTAKRRIILN